MLPFLSDKIIFVTSLIVTIFGLIMIYSTTAVIAESRYGDAYYFVKRQGLAAVIGTILLILTSYLNVNKIKKYTPFFLILSLLLLALVFIPGIGTRAGGALRWVAFGPIRFQPVELVKILMVFFMAGYIARNDARLKEFKYCILMPLLIIGIVSFQLLLQPDFGSAAVIAFTAIVLIFVAGGSLLYLSAGAALLGGIASILILISPYRLSRILSFLDPFKDQSGQGYQLIQSLIAIGNGGLAGVGIGESQQKLFFLPAAHNDFIFAVIGEELGFIGCAALLLMFLIILWRGMVLARKFAHDTFFFCLAIGLTTVLVLPALLNLGVALGLLPTKGLALPLVSYGGSSLIVSLMSIGLLLALSRSYNSLNR